MFKFESGSLDKKKLEYKKNNPKFMDVFEMKRS